MRTLVILGLAYILFIHGIGSVTLWDPDEPRQAIMAREMVERGDYIHPYLNGMPYLEKPPLYSWAIVIVSKITGSINEFSSRLPSALAAAMLLLTTYFLGRRLDHEGICIFLSALILATNYQFLGNARYFGHGYDLCPFHRAGHFSRLYLYGKGAKGDSALCPPALRLCHPHQGPRRTRHSRGRSFLLQYRHKALQSMFVPLAASCLLSIAVASIWFILAGRAYAEEFLLHQNIVRYTTGFDHVEPFTYYFYKLFVNFLPWSVALPFAAFFAYKKRLWLPLIWLVATFLFFDISKSKRAIYLLSGYPACALLVGIYLKEQWYTLLEKGWTTAILCFFGLALLSVPALLFPAIHRVPLVAAMFGKDLLFPAIIAAVLGIAGIVFLISLIKKAPAEGFMALFVYLCFLGFLYHFLYMPAMDASEKSITAITNESRLREPPRFTCTASTPRLLSTTRGSLYIF